MCIDETELDSSCDDDGAGGGDARAAAAEARVIARRERRAEVTPVHTLVSSGGAVCRCDACCCLRRRMHACPSPSASPATVHCAHEGEKGCGAEAHAGSCIRAMNIYTHTLCQPVSLAVPLSLVSVLIPHSLLSFSCCHCCRCSSSCASSALLLPSTLTAAVGPAQEA